MAPVGLNALYHFAHLFWRLPVNIVENELSISEDRIQRCTEFMTHVGDELRLVLAFGLELTTFFIDLTKQARILDGEHRLCGEGLDEVDSPIRKVPGLRASNHKKAHSLIRTHQRSSQNGSISGTHNEVAERCKRFLMDVWDLNRFTPFDGGRDVWIG